MSMLNSKRNAVFIFAILMASIMFGFQNCSSSVFMLSNTQPVQAKTDFNEIINNNEKEISKTKTNFRSDVNVPSSFELDPKNRQVANAENVYPKTDLKVKLKSKKRIKKIR
ncbi:MAG: hypothetical protein WA160_03345 [Pseudobdellovibrio sp.]